MAETNASGAPRHPVPDFILPGEDLCAPRLAIVGPEDPDPEDPDPDAQAIALACARRCVERSAARCAQRRAQHRAERRAERRVERRAERRAARRAVLRTQALRINIHLQYDPHTTFMVCRVYLKHTTPFRRMLQAFDRNYDVQRSDYTMRYAGAQITEVQTPGDFGMQNGAIINCIITPGA